MTYAERLAGIEGNLSTNMDELVVVGAAHDGNLVSIRVGGDISVILEYENSVENCQINDEALDAGLRSVQEKGLLSLHSRDSTASCPPRIHFRGAAEMLGRVKMI